MSSAVESGPPESATVRRVVGVIAAGRMNLGSAISYRACMAEGWRGGVDLLELLQLTDAL